MIPTLLPCAHQYEYNCATLARLFVMHLCSDLGLASKTLADGLVLTPCCSVLYRSSGDGVLRATLEERARVLEEAGEQYVLSGREKLTSGVLVVLAFVSAWRRGWRSSPDGEVS